MIIGTIPCQEMRAIEIVSPGGPDMLQLSRRPVPRPGPSEVLIKVAFAGVNRPDALQRAGLYRPPPDASDLPGLEAAGQIVAKGLNSPWEIGDQVCALLPGGGYSEYAIAPGAHALPVPRALDLRQAACLPETVFTVWSNLIHRAALVGGERLLVHGGSSGIGTTAIQIARALGVRVFVTAGSAAKCAACERLGAERAINYREEDFVDIMRAVGGADVILDMVGGSYGPRNLRALADDGRLVQIAVLEGAKSEISLAQVMMRRLTITGSTLRPMSDQVKARICADIEKKVWPMVAAGKLRPIIDREFALQDAREAHELMESSSHIGKIVLNVGGDV